MLKYVLLILLLPTFVFSQISYKNKKECSTRDSVNLSSHFPSPGNQGNSYTCLGWALVYGLISYDINKSTGKYLSKVDLSNYSKNQDILILSPTYNFGGMSDYCKGVTAESMFNSIATRGVALFKPTHSPSNCSFDTSGEKIESLKFNKTDFNLFGPNNNEKGFSSNELINHFDCIGPFVLDIKNHSMLCVGYDKSKKVLKLINSQDLIEEKNYCEKSFNNLRDIKLIISLKNQDEKIAINDSETSEVSFTLDSNYYYMGNPQNPDNTHERIWWLGKPSVGLPWKHKRYYYTQHLEKFCISVLKLGYFSKKAIIGVYDKNRKSLIYTFNIEPEDEVAFIVDNESYNFKYIRKSFNRGVFFYPEINYTIMKSN